MRRGWLWGAIGGWLIATAWLVACSNGSAAVPETSLLDASPASANQKLPNDATPAAMDGTHPVDTTEDAGPRDAALEDARDADAALPVLKRFSGTIDFNGPFAGAKVELLQPSQESLITDETGNFFFYAPNHSVAVVKATPPADAGAYPMIRGIVVEDGARIRIFYLQAKSDLDGLSSLGLTLDETKAMVEVDFRNATTGGYGVTMTNSSGAMVPPGFGLASGESGFEKSLVTVRGGDGTTMFYGNVPPGTVAFTPVFPSDAGHPTTPCDAPELPLEPGVVTWFDFECGTANCQ